MLYFSIFFRPKETQDGNMEKYSIYPPGGGKVKKILKTHRKIFSPHILFKKVQKIFSQNFSFFTDFSSW
jgi:hypothetical protein